MRVSMRLLSAGIALMSAGLAAAEEAKLPPVRAAATVQADVPKLECARPQLKLLPNPHAILGQRAKVLNLCTDSKRWDAVIFPATAPK